MRPSDKVMNSGNAIDQFAMKCEGNYEVAYLRRLYNLRIKAFQMGDAKSDRTGVGRHSIFGGYITHDTSVYGPAFMLSKNVFAKGVFAELAWFLRGETNIKNLLAEDVHIWDEWANKEGDLGPIYGAQWRYASSLKDVGGHGPECLMEVEFDQIYEMLARALKNPHDSGLLVSAWQVKDLDDMALRPCHTQFQICIENGKLDLMLYQRSADWFLGVPFNAASYTTLQILFAKLLGLEPGTFHHYFGDTHIYANHLEAVDEQLERLSSESVRTGELFTPVQRFREAHRVPHLDIPSLVPLAGEVPLNVLKKIATTDFKLSNYKPEPAISAPVAV